MKENASLMKLVIASVRELHRVINVTKDFKNLMNNLRPTI
jgi:hypothetical protein